MRLFETILFMLLLVGGLRLFFPVPGIRRRVDLALFTALSSTGLLHLLLEGPRWQMYPLYGLAILGLIYLSSVIITPPARTRPRAWLVALFLVLALTLSLPPVLFPVPNLPEPSGPYSIGTTTFSWVDEERIDPYSGEARRLLVQAWYPAEPGPRAERAPYFENLNIAGPVIARQFGLPPFLLNHIHLVQTNSYLEAPISEQAEAYPVLLFSHGWTGIRGQNTFQVEELASQGYVIFSADHTYGAALVVFPSGEVVFNYSEALPSGVSEEAYDRSARVLGQTWVGDLIFVLDQAEKVQAGEIGSPLEGRLNLEQVGALGHSTGGGAVVEFCYVDERCLGGLAMDAWLIPYDREIASQGLERPFLFMQSERWNVRRNRPLVEALLENSSGPTYEMVILGTQHYDFADLTLVSPLAPLVGLKGPLPTVRVMEIVKRYTTAFFNGIMVEGDWRPQEFGEEYIEVQMETRGVED